MQSTDSLHIKASEGDVAGVEQMLGTGVIVDQTDGQGCTALHWAADRGRDQVINGWWVDRLTSAITLHSDSG